MFLEINDYQTKLKTIVLVLIGLAAAAGLLVLGGTTAARAQGDGDVEYTIRSGDTMYEIAQSFDTTVEILLEANPDISDPDYILAGENLTVPSGDLPPRTAVLGPTNGPPGSILEFRGEGYQPDRELQVLFGPVDSEAVSIKTIRADDDGHVKTELIIPANALPGATWIASVQPLDDPDVYQEQSNTFEVESSQGHLQDKNETIVYLVDTDDNGENGELIGCEDSLIPVSLSVDPDADPLRATLQKLFDLGDTHTPSGLYNSLHQSDLAVDRIEMDGKTTSVYLTGTPQLGGVCDEPRAEFQLLETINQFPEINDAVVFINDKEMYTEEDQQKGEDNQTYTVQPDDVLSHIAVSFRTTVPAIARRNPDLGKPSLISVGQEIVIPGTDDDAPLLQILPTNGKPGTVVEYRAKNLLPHRTYTVGVGQINAEYDRVMDIVTDHSGSAHGKVTTPEGAVVDQYWVVTLDSSTAPDLQVVSNLFEVE